MSYMSELWITISEMLEDGDTPLQISTRLNIPVEWVNNVSEECYFGPSADEYADADAQAYGEE